MYKVHLYVKSREFLEKVDVIQNMLSSTGDVNNDAENIEMTFNCFSSGVAKIL